MIDTVRGVLRVRKWPKKRGPPKSALQRFWIDWFTQANLLAKFADPMSQVRAIEMTKGTGLYPRDVLLSAMRGRLYWWADETGWKWFPMAATQDVSNSLDTLSQVVGSILVRAVDRWRAPAPGGVDDVLTYQGGAAAPTWQNPRAMPGGYGCLITNAAPQAILNLTPTFLTFDSEEYDDLAFHDPAVNPTRITIPAGTFRAILFATVLWQANAGGNYRTSLIPKNGSGAAYPGRGLQITGTLGGAKQVGQTINSGVLDVSPGDYFELLVEHDAGVTLNIFAVGTSFGVVLNP